MSANLIHLLLLIIIANGAPIILRALMGHRLDFAIDSGYRLPDNNPLFGSSKTWRGVIGAFIFTSIGAILLGYPALTGAQIALYAVLGDVLSSFIKRRLGMAPSSMAPLLDQVPESLLPAVMLMDTFELDLQSIVILVCVFVLVELLLSYIFFKLGIRNRPY
jgi:CDP-2,3-bis-(O-geranylgeranyl)-sn-glycerol synthase